MSYCWSLGPRIGNEGTPVCFRTEGHAGSHQSHPDSGFNVSWGNPVNAVPEHQRERFWTPDASRICGGGDA